MSKNHNQWLDLVRSTAITLVLISHSRYFIIEQWPIANIMKFGGFIGVELFFVLSGFLVGRILASFSHDFTIDTIKTFFIRRWLRTLPTYYLFLFIAALLSITGLRPDNLSKFYQYLFFIQNLASAHPNFFGEAWSLCIEEIFYFTFPILSAIFCRLFKLPTKPAMIAVGVSVLFFCSLYRLHTAEILGINWDSDIRKVAILRLDSIMVGVLAAFIYTSKFRVIFSRNFLLSLLSLFAFSIIYSGISPSEELNKSIFAKTVFFNVTSLGCLGFVLIGLDLKFSNTLELLFNFMARISYSAYLCNLSIAIIINKHLKFAPEIKWLIFFPSVLIISWISYKLWEKKFITYRDIKWQIHSQQKTLDPLG